MIRNIPLNMIRNKTQITKRFCHTHSKTNFDKPNTNSEIFIEQLNVRLLPIYNETLKISQDVNLIYILNLCTFFVLCFK